jgi:hypothetical protein
VKKFNTNRLQKVLIFISVIVLILLLWPDQDLDEIRTHRFCAYGHVFVEFEHNGKVWGTTFLNQSGKPVNCDEDDFKSESVSSWNNII